MNRRIVLRTSWRDRIERQVQNSILANAVRVGLANGIFDPKTPEDKAKRIAERVTEELLKDYKLVRRT